MLAQQFVIFGEAAKRGNGAQGHHHNQETSYCFYALIPAVIFPNTIKNTSWNRASNGHRTGAVLTSPTAATLEAKTENPSQ